MLCFGFLTCTRAHFPATTTAGGARDVVKFRVQYPRPGFTSVGTIVLQCNGATYAWFRNVVHVCTVPKEAYTHTLPAAQANVNNMPRNNNNFNSPSLQPAPAQPLPTTAAYSSRLKLSTAWTVGSF